MNTYRIPRWTNFVDYTKFMESVSNGNLDEVKDAIQLENFNVNFADEKDYLRGQIGKLMF